MHSEAQKVALALGRMIASWFALVASMTIVYKIYLRYRDHQRRKEQTTATAVIDSGEVSIYHRLILGMSVLEIINTLGSAVGALAVPSSTGVAFGLGTTATCSAQGVAYQIGNGVPVYIAALNTYFMLKICHNVSDTVIRQRYEVWFHAVPIMYAFVSAMIGVGLHLFNPIAVPEIGCWISPYPIGCLKQGGSTCTRGYRMVELMEVYLWVLCYGWLIASFFVVVANSILIYASIRRQERRNSAYFGARVQQTTPAVQLEQKPPSPLGPLTSSLSGSVEPDCQSSHESIQNTLGSDEIVVATHSTGSSKNESMRHTYASTSFVPASSLSFGLSRRESLRSSRRESLQGRQSTRIKASRVAAVQSTLYCTTAFTLALIFMLPWIANRTSASSNTTFGLALFINILGPSQGIFHLIIFVRLQYNRLRETETEWSRWKCLHVCLTSAASSK